MKPPPSWFAKPITAAGDPSKYPEQLREGLRPWQPRKLYFAAPSPPPARSGRARRRVLRSRVRAPVKLTPANTNTYDELLGRTYAEIGADARSNHKCQGISGLPACPDSIADAAAVAVRPALLRPRQAVAVVALAGPPFGGPFAAGYQLIDTTIPQQKEKTETSLFDGVDFRLEAIAQYAGPNPPAALTTAIAAIAADARAARTAFDAGNDAATRQPIEAGLAAIRSLRAQLSSMGLDEAARYELDFRLRIKERDYEDAVLAAHGLTFDAVADDGLVICRTAREALYSCSEPRPVGCERDRRLDRRPGCAHSLRARRSEEGRGLHLHVRGERPAECRSDHALLP